MNQKILFFLAATLLFGACSGHPDSRNPEEDTDRSRTGGEITLPAEQAERFGVRSDTVRTGEFAPAIQVGAEILPSTTSTGIAVAAKSGIIHLTAKPGTKIHRGEGLATVSATRMAGGDDATAARVAYEAAKREKERLEPLHKEGIVTSATYNAAVRDYESARAAYSAGASSSAVTAPLSGTITEMLVAEGEHVPAGAPVARISTNTLMTLKAYVPATRAAEAAAIRSARFTTEGRTVDAHLVNAAMPEAEGGFIPLYFEFDATGTLPANRPVEAWLLPAPRDGVIALPREAVVEQQGTWWAFVKLDDDCYEKRRITIGVSDGERIEITSGLHPGEIAVTSGAMIVRLAESAGAVPEGHSHNH